MNWVVSYEMLATHYTVIPFFKIVIPTRSNAVIPARPNAVIPAVF